MDRLQDLTALLKHEIEDLISAEDQIIEAMPAMIEAAKNSNLKKSLRDHLKVTRVQRKRLDKVQKLLGVNDKNNESKGFLSNLFGGLTRHECKGMKGIIEEGNKLMGADMADTVKDAAILASSQKVEHYEICGYGTARAYAKELNMAEVAKLLEETLNEEYEADKLLTKLAEGNINEKAEGKPAAKSSNGPGKSPATKGIKIASTAKGSTASSNGTAKAKAPAAKAATKRTAKAGKK